MARLNTTVIDSDEELPDISILLAPRARRAHDTPSSRRIKEVPWDESQRAPIPVAESGSPRRQRPLGLVHANSLLLPLASGVRRGNGVGGEGSDGGIMSKDGRREQQHKPVELVVADDARPSRQTARASPRKINHGLCFSDENISDGDSMSDFIVDDSASDIELPVSRSPRKGTNDLAGRPKSPRKPTFRAQPIDLTSPEKPRPKTSARPVTPPEAASRKVFLGEESLGRLRFSPPRSRTPHRRTDDVKVTTPPSSPSKAGLQSPSKRSNRIPPSPHRPSIDAFWSQEVINDWNDQHSPRKPVSPRKLFSVRGDDDGYLSPSTSPRRSPAKTPRKKDKAVIERRKAFQEMKEQLAVDFLKELDDKVAEGRIAALAESSGGIRIIWSKKLNSTAGRANWKREALVSKDAAGASTKVYRHHASIELAEKVIDDEERLVNVLAHEYCHLANFMISGIKKNPHGKEFKQWAAKTTRLFSHRNITVTTKHTYAISYKYIWQCQSCGLEYKRHSRSIDPAKHSCGVCKEKLVQIQPAPRKAKIGKGEGVQVAPSAYQAYVKSHCARVRRENPGMGLGEVMKRLGEEFREMKARGSVEGVDSEESVEVMVDDDDEEEEEEEDVAVSGRDDSTDDVVRKLDFLNLG